ncbi:MAG: TAXI family TRAP transporter solute-binding subunit [Casimicrobium sp.]
MIRRSYFLIVGVLVGVFTAGCTSPPVAPSLRSVEIHSAGQGSAFLPYAQGIAKHLSNNGLSATALESTGSIDNIRKLNDSPNALATVFIATANEGFTGGATWTQGKVFSNIRALVPMYETSFQFVAMRLSGISSLEQLNARKVGVGPAGGPGELYFKALAEMSGITPQIVTGAPNALANDLLANKIDALWQGAIVPIPSIRQVAENGDAVVFGLSPAAQKAMIDRFPILSPTTVAAKSYRGQGEAILSVAAWNYLMVHAKMSEADAYWITKTILEVADPEVSIHPSAKATRAQSATTNRVIPFHEGAARYYRERGIATVKQ